MTTEIVKTTLKGIAEPEKRAEAWKSFLGNMFLCETENLNSVIKFLNGAEDIDDILPDVSIASIPKINELETLLKSVKESAKSCENARKEFTSKLGDITTRMMIPEKTFAGFQKEIENTLIQLKKLEKAENEKKAAREKELADFKMRREVAFADEVAALKSHIAGKISDHFKTALDRCAAHEINSYVDRVKGAMLAQINFYVPNSQWGDAEKQAIQDAITNSFDAEGTKKQMISDIDAAFANFDIDKANKEEAIKRQQEEDKKKLEALEEERKNDIAFSQVKSSVSIPVETQGTKALQVKYSVANKHDEENMTVVARAFFANINNCIKLYRGSDPFDISISKMCDMLCSMKEKDAKFQPAGILFVEVDKLGR